MRKFAALAIVCLILMSLYPAESYAQQNSSQWFVVFEESVSPANRTQFDKVQKEAVDLWKKHKMDVPIYAYGNDDNAIYWVVPIQSFASIDTLYQKMGQLTNSMKEEDNYNGNEKFRDLSTMSQSVIMHAPELSYHPDGQDGQTAETPYVEWMFCKLRSGHEQEAADVIKKYISFYKQNNIGSSWDAYQVMFGNDLPQIILMFSDKDRAAMASKDNALREKYSTDFDNMWKDFRQHVRSIDNKTGWFMPSYSNMPGMTVSSDR